MKRLRRDDVTMNLNSRGVVIRGLPERGLSFSLPDCRNMLADNKLYFHCHKTTCHISNTCNSFKKSKRDTSVIYDNSGRRPMLATTLFSSDYCNENNSLSISNIIWDNYVAGLPQHVPIVYFEILLIRSNRDIIYDTIDKYM